MHRMANGRPANAMKRKRSSVKEVGLSTDSLIVSLLHDDDIYIIEVVKIN